MKKKRKAIKIVPRYNWEYENTITLFLDEIEAYGVSYPNSERYCEIKTKSKRRIYTDLFVIDYLNEVFEKECKIVDLTTEPTLLKHPQIKDGDLADILVQLQEMGVKINGI